MTTPFLFNLPMHRVVHVWLIVVSALMCPRIDRDRGMECTRYCERERKKVQEQEKMTNCLGIKHIMYKVFQFVLKIEEFHYK